MFSMTQKVYFWAPRTNNSKKSLTGEQHTLQKGRWCGDLHYADFIGAHSPFNTVHKWVRGGLIEWVCGFLLTLQGPLHPTPARKQIKLQFHHLEGAVSCPNAALGPPLSTYTRTQNSTPPPHQSCSAPPPPKCQPLSTAQLPRGMEGFEGRKRERGGWVVGKAKGIGSSFIPVKYFALEKAYGVRESRGMRDRKASR